MLAIAFLIVFVAAHVVDGTGGAFDRPLSDFRYAEPAWVGYLMFVLMIAIAAEMSRIARRLRDRLQLAVYTTVTISLTVIALTPSNTPLHHLATDVTMLALTLNFAWLFDQRDMPYWLTASLSIPLLFAIAIAMYPSGSLQKLLDLYFMAAVMFHHHALARSLTTDRHKIDQPGAERQPTPNVL